MSNKYKLEGYMFSLATVYDAREGTYSEFGPEQFSVVKPNVPEKSIKDLREVYAVDHRDDFKKKFMAAALEEFNKFNGDSERSVTQRNVILSLMWQLGMYNEFYDATVRKIV